VFVVYFGSIGTFRPVQALKGSKIIYI